jgi:hypothetical protein
MDSERLKQEPTALLVIFMVHFICFLGPQGETRKRILTNSTIIDDKPRLLERRSNYRFPLQKERLCRK